MFGTMNPKSLRHGWQKSENLQLLGDAVGIELELEAQEKNVGPISRRHFM